MLTRVFLLVTVLFCLETRSLSSSDFQPLTPFMESFSGRVFVVGDSTASVYEPRRYPRMGWAQVLDTFYDQRVSIFDLAKSGRSTKSYISEGYFDALAAHLVKGDLLIIQFGHNDSKVTAPERYAPADGLYQELLTKYIDLAKSKGATPILFTSVVRRAWENGALKATLTDYVNAMKKVAERTGTPLVDMNAFTRDLVSSHGEEGSKALYLHLEVGETPLSRKEAVVDNTHFSEKGAYLVAEFAADQLDTLGLKPFRIKSSGSVN